MTATMHFSAKGITIPMLNRQIRFRNRADIFSILQQQKENLRRFYGTHTSVQVEVFDQDKTILVTYVDL